MHAEDAIDLLVGRIRSLIDQMFGTHYNTGRAKAALQSSCSDETLGKGIALKLAEAFKREDGLSQDALGRHRARDNRSAIDDHRAATALTLRAAAVLGRDQTAPVTQRFE